MGWARWLQATAFRGISLSRFRRIMEDVTALFEGRFPGYRSCDTRYHDLEHTLRLIPPFCRMVAGMGKEARHRISSRDVELGLIAVLLHDSGYIRTVDDARGTGAKYTFQHIERSVAFARSYLPPLGYTPREHKCVEEMIRCTGVKAEMEQDRFQSKACRSLGYALGTADLLAQMADPSYVEKLPLLFEEFHEAYEHEGDVSLAAAGVQRFESAETLIRKTPLFYKHVVLKRFQAMGNLQTFLEDPGTGRNPFLERIERHMEAILRR
jgi:hypothetical protein